MSKFLTPLDMRLMTTADGELLRTRAGRQLWVLLAPFWYQSDVAGFIVVPAGFVTDLASFPQITLSLLGDIGQEPSIPHDYAYSTHCMPREVADKMLREACIVNGVPAWKAWLIFQGVRIGGGSHWGDGKAPSVTDPQPQASPA